MPNSIIKDPTGRLLEIHEQVRKEYPRKKWVVRRCEGAKKRVLDVLDGMLEKFGYGTDTAWESVFTLYYATFAAAEMFALADLRNPTIRKSFVVSRHVLEHCDQVDVHESLLEVLGAATLTVDHVCRHQKALYVALEEASNVLQHPFFFSDKLMKGSRSCLLNGVQEILDMGCHREAVFWIHFMMAIAQKAIEADAPVHDKVRFQKTYQTILADLGLQTDEQVQVHRRRLHDLLPRIWEVAEVVMSKNPTICD